MNFYKLNQYCTGKYGDFHQIEDPVSIAEFRRKVVNDASSPNNTSELIRRLLRKRHENCEPSDIRFNKCLSPKVI